MTIYIEYFRRYFIWTLLIGIVVAIGTYFIVKQNNQLYRTSVHVRFSGLWKDYLVSTKKPQKIYRSSFNKNELVEIDKKEDISLDQIKIDFMDFRHHLNFKIVVKGNSEKYPEELLLEIANKIVEEEERLLDVWSNNIKQEIDKLQKLQIKVPDKIEQCKMRLEEMEKENLENTSGYLQLFASYISMRESLTRIKVKLKDYQRVFNDNANNKVYVDKGKLKNLPLGIMLSVIMGVLFFFILSYFIVIFSLWKRSE